ncbi:MAG TPA: serine/threonine-protein kinase, partial [Nannocystis sp.]
MGEVWRAVHRDEHTPVAIKVIGPHWARQPSYRQAFAREVRAIAGLVHPGIVAVHDQGVVGAAAARASGDRIAADSPYLVMEYMPRGSLEGLLGALDWPLVRVLLREILEALAHAHARGIVHCDLKPGNVLLSGTVDVAIKLTDFGVAHALAPGDSLIGDDTPRSAGTPAYMAPEQLLGLWRDFGPWTDLYALGCMLWELCCGTPPFVAGSLVRLAGMHLHEPPGRFTPCFAVPANFEGWLRRLLAKQTRERFACAADAAWALAKLPGPAAPERLSWAAVAAHNAEVDRAAPTQPLPAAIEPPVTDRAAWSVDSTLVGPVVQAAGAGAATADGGARRTAREGAVEVGGATQRTGDVIDVGGATRSGDAVEVGGATQFKDAVDVGGATRLGDAVDVGGATRLGDAVDVGGA